MRRAPAIRPTRPAIDQLRPAVPTTATAPRLARRRFDQLEQGRLSPVQVLDQHDRRPLRGESGQELDPRVLKAIPRDQRMQSSAASSRA